MERNQKLYLSLLSKIWLKSVLRAFMQFKFSLYSTPQPKQAKRELKSSKDTKEVYNKDRFSKIKSLTEASIKKLIDEPKDIFQELKSNLQKKILQGEITPVKLDEVPKTPKSMHIKNSLSFSSAYFNKGSRKFLVKSPPEIQNDLVVVSSSSLASIKEKKNNIFCFNK